MSGRATIARRGPELVEWVRVSSYTISPKIPLTQDREAKDAASICAALSLHTIGIDSQIPLRERIIVSMGEDYRAGVVW